VLATLNYVNVTRGLLSTTVTVGVAAAATALTYLGIWVRERRLREM